MTNVGGKSEDLVLDKFVVISSPKKSYVLKGEKYETELSLGATSSAKSNTRITLSVNGRALKVNDDGTANWSTTAAGLGTKKYNVKATVFNPVTEKTETYTKEYEYTVGESSVSVSALKNECILYRC